MGLLLVAQGGFKGLVGCYRTPRGPFSSAATLATVTIIVQEGYQFATRFLKATCVDFRNASCTMSVAGDPTLPVRSPLWDRGGGHTWRRRRRRPRCRRPR